VVGLDHVADHLVPIATTTSGALSKGRRRRGRDTVEDRPCRRDEVRQPFGVGGGHHPAIGVRDRGRDAEVRAAAARHAVDDVQDGLIEVRHLEVGDADDGGVARCILDESVTG
jgi:hypothetical protein